MLKIVRNIESYEALKIVINYKELWEIVDWVWPPVGGDMAYTHLPFVIDNQQIFTYQGSKKL